MFAGLTAGSVSDNIYTDAYEQRQRNPFRPETLHIWMLKGLVWAIAINGKIAP
jgi:hypothetical protein